MPLCTLFERNVQEEISREEYGASFAVLCVARAFVLFTSCACVLSFVLSSVLVCVLCCSDCVLCTSVGGYVLELPVTCITASCALFCSK